MSERWFRFYDGVVDDPKVQRLPPALFKLWVNLMCLTSRNGGAFPALVDMAFSLRVTEKKLTTDLEALQAAGLVDEIDGKATPHNWTGRQYESDSAAERMRRYRERNKIKESDAPLRNALRTSDAVEDRVQKTDTEKKKEDAPPAALAPTKPVRGTRWKAEDKVPEEWIREGEMRRIEHGLPAINLVLEAETFVNYWSSKSGKDATKINWHATWLNRALKAEGPRNSAGRISAHDKGTQGAALFLADYEARERARTDDRTGTSRDIVPANGHGRSEVATPIRNLQRRFQDEDAGANPLRLPAVAAKS